MKKLYGVQYLRAAAALGVVVFHAAERSGGHFVIELTREGRMDEMTVVAEARPERWDGSGLLEHTE